MSSTPPRCQSVASSLALVLALGLGGRGLAQDLPTPPTVPDANAGDPLPSPDTPAGPASGPVTAAEPPAQHEDAPPALPPLLEPPEALVLAKATYPAQALAAGLEGVVVLRVQVEVDGHVSEAEVVEGLGHGLDEAAREALLASTFRAARRDGVDIPARILFRYAFALPAPVSPVATPPTAPLDFGTAVEVRVRNKPAEGERVLNSSEAVTVVKLEDARRRAADLGEVMSRTQGVTLRRSGGLGSEARFALNGLANDQIRFFLDGVPLDVAGYPFELGNVPVNLLERVDVYRGVVPLRLSADALGGAVNVIPRSLDETGAAGSYQVGSFGTHRATLWGGYRHEPSGFVAGLEAFVDSARNDYEIDVEVPDERGRLRPARVKRFHDGYFANGVSLNAGFVERPWAKKLMLRAYTTGYDKELQNNVVMTVPYGEVRYGERVTGGTVAYEQPLHRDLELTLVFAYAHRTIEFVDESQWVYDWFGNQVRERRVAGEIEGQPTDQTHWQETGFGRALLGYTLAPGHVVRVGMTANHVTRTGDEKIQIDPNARDPLTAERRMFSLVSGIEYESNFWLREDAPHAPAERSTDLDYRVQNTLIAKSYVYRSFSEEELPGGTFRKLDQGANDFGVGDSLRVSVTSYLMVKGSYEYATRLPRPDEVFGNGVLVHANLELRPEVSHNANLGPRFSFGRPRQGQFTLDVNGFLRESDRLIVLLGNDKSFTYQNVYRARSLGVEGAITWVSPRRYVQMDATATWTERRNTSRQGTFAAFEGDRIPNNPYLNTAFGATLHFEKVALRGDELEPYYQGRFVHEFFRGWESVGLRDSKQVIPAQLSHTVGIQYALRRDPRVLSLTFEVQNVSDAELYDFFGVQRPGRAYYAKLTGDL